MAKWSSILACCWLLISLTACNGWQLKGDTDTSSVSSNSGLMGNLCISYARVTDRSLVRLHFPLCAADAAANFGLNELVIKRLSFSSTDSVKDPYGRATRVVITGVLEITLSVAASGELLTKQFSASRFIRRFPSQPLVNAELEADEKQRLLDALRQHLMRWLQQQSGALEWK